MAYIVLREARIFPKVINLYICEFLGYRKTWAECWKQRCCDIINIEQDEHCYYNVMRLSTRIMEMIRNGNGDEYPLHFYRFHDVLTELSQFHPIKYTYTELPIPKHKLLHYMYEKHGAKVKRLQDAYCGVDMGYLNMVWKNS